MHTSLPGQESAATGNLFLVATPIGNLDDITLRALKILGTVDLIAAEDTRTTRKLLAHHGLRRPLISFGQHNEARRTEALVAALANGDVALVSDAGTPAISDPGYALVDAAVAAGYRVIPIPGPSAALAALAASGLPSDRFLFLGFLPRRSGERRRRLQEFSGLQATLVVYEAPHRVQETLTDVLAVLGDRRIAVARELTKVHEEVFRGTIAEARSYFEEPRGEFTFVIGQALSPPVPAENDVVAQAVELHAQGLTAGVIAARLARETGLPRRRIYQQLAESNRTEKRS